MNFLRLYDARPSFSLVAEGAAFVILDVAETKVAVCVGKTVVVFHRLHPFPLLHPTHL